MDNIKFDKKWSNVGKLNWNWNRFGKGYAISRVSITFRIEYAEESTRIHSTCICIRSMISPWFLHILVLSRLSGCSFDPTILGKHSVGECHARSSSARDCWGWLGKLIRRNFTEGRLPPSSFLQRKLEASGEASTKSLSAVSTLM